MKQFKPYRLFFITVLGGVVFPWAVCATHIAIGSQPVAIQDRPESQLPVASPAVVKKPIRRILYIPPKPIHNGRPNTRTTQGGTRGDVGSGLPVVTLLTPNRYKILTAHSQPVLYWHLSRAIQNPVTVTLTADEAEPLMEYVISTASDAGVHSLRLAEQGVTLLPGKLYEWSVCVQQGEEAFSAGDLIAKSFIELSVPGGGVEQMANTQAYPVSQAEALARSGFWYDALEALMETSLEVESGVLLKQVGLSFFNAQP